jgi:hypothetical protein
MTVLASLISDYGWAAVATAAVIYVLVQSEIRIHYPGRSRADDSKLSPKKPQ